MPAKIQLAIQGGGAKIFGLLAAIGAVQLMTKEGKLEVTRIAGTSAGALAASLFAAGIDLQDFRHRLDDGLAERIIRNFNPPGVKQWAQLLLFGRPFWKDSALTRELNILFVQEQKIKTIADAKMKTGIELSIVSADLHNLQRIIHPQTDDIVDAIADSCGIPFCFRTWSGSRANRVDGGICENLPVEALVNQSSEYGPVLAISFDRPKPEPPDNLRRFSMALLDAAIDNSVQRALHQLGAEQVFTVRSRFGTFDFENAIREGLGDYFDLVQIEAKSFFETYLDPDSMTLGDPWTDGDLTTMLKLGEVYKAQHAHVPLRYEHCRLDVTVNSLNNSTEADYVRYSATVTAIDQPVHCHRVALSTAEHKTSIQKTFVSVYDEGRKQKVETIRIPMKDPDNMALRPLLINFVPVLQPREGPYTLTIADSVYGAMKPLVNQGQDELKLNPSRASGVLKTVDFIVRIPERYENAKMQNKPGEGWGRALNEYELRDRTTPGFRTLGWTGDDLESSRSWAVDIIRS